jgi:hypothetical protein
MLYLNRNEQPSIARPTSCYDCFVINKEYISSVVENTDCEFKATNYKNGGVMSKSKKISIEGKEITIIVDREKKYFLLTEDLTVIL